MSELVDWTDLMDMCTEKQLESCTPNFNVWKRMNETRERAKVTTVKTTVPLANGEKIEVTDEWYKTMVRDMEIAASITFASNIKDYAGGKDKGQASSYKAFYEDYKGMF